MVIASNPQEEIKVMIEETDLMTQAECLLLFELVYCFSRIRSIILNDFPTSTVDPLAGRRPYGPIQIS
jgi:hypothetical protein